MNDITITHDSELMVAGIDGETESGVDFVDAWMPQGDTDYSVVDSGRIVVSEKNAIAFAEAAKLAGLKIEEDSR